MFTRNAASRVAIVLAGGKAAGVAGAATLASAFFVSVAVPSLSILPPPTSTSQQLIAISLQSALLGIDDGLGRPSSRIDLAEARRLGVASEDVDGLTLAQLRVLVAHHAVKPNVTPIVVEAKIDDARNALNVQSTSLATTAPAATQSQPPDATPAAHDPQPAAPSPQTSSSDTPATTPQHVSAPSQPGSAPAPAAPPHVVDPQPVPAPAPPTIELHGEMTAEATSALGALVAYTPPAASDANGSVAISCAPVSGALFPVGTTTVTCSSHNAGGRASSRFDVDVHDTTPPVLQLPAGVSVVADSGDGTVVTFAATATDLVDGPVATTCSPASGNFFPIGSTQVDCSATDATGNSARAAFTVSVAATPEAAPPVFAAQADVVANATGPNGATVNYALPVATDLNGGTDPVSCLPAAGSVFALGTTTVTCAAQSSAGVGAELAFAVSVQDTTPPALHLPTGISVAATSAAGATVTYTATATDLVDGSVPVTCLPASGGTFASGATQVTCSASDSHGNIVDSSFIVAVGDTPDTIPPTVAAHPNVNAEATSASGAVVTYTLPSANDDRDGAVSVACLPVSGSLFALGTTTVTCSAHDAAGNSGSSSFSVHVADSTPPTIAAHADVDADSTGTNGAVVTYTSPTASDGLDGAVAVSCLPASGGLFPLGTTTVTCSAHDSAGNATSSTFHVVVADDTPPTIANAADITAEATGSGGAAVAYTPPTANDNVDGPLAVACLPASGSQFPVGSTQVTCSTQDSAGNHATSTFDVDVVDTTPPVLVVPAEIDVTATGPGGSTVSYSASADDLVDGSVTPSCLPASGSLFALGATTVDCSATDTAGNTATAAFEIFVGTGSSPDTTPPVIDAHSNVSVEATGALGATVTYTAPSATDDRDGSVPVSCLPASGSDFPLGNTTVSCSAHDSAGNNATTTFVVHVRDTTSPTIAAHANLNAEATGSGGATVTYVSPTATDTVDGAVTVSCLPASGTVFPLGTTTVTCTAHDVSGNTTSSTFTVGVADTTPPTVTAHANVTVEATGSSGATITYVAPTATDSVNGSVAVSCLPASGSSFPLGNTTVTCTAHDGAGNTATSTFVATVRDTTPPTLSIPSAVMVDATSGAGATVTFTATATDAVDGTDAVICLPASGTVFAIGNTTVTCNTQDAAGNHAATQTFVVTVQSAPGQLAELNQVVNAMTLDSGFSNQLIQFINHAAQSIAQGNTNDASHQLASLAQTAIDEVGKSNSRLTLAEAEAIVADANEIQVVIGTIAVSSVIPAAEASDLNIVSTIDSFGLQGGPVDGPRTDAAHAGDQLVGGDVHGACQTLANLLTSGPVQQWTQAQINALTAAVAATRQLLGC